MNNSHWKAVSTPPPPATRVSVGAQRRDGKYLVTYFFQGKTLRKLRTAAEVAKIRADNSYTVRAR